MNASQEKIQKMSQSNEDAMKEMKDLRITEQETEKKFKETLKRFFKVEAQLLKVTFKLRWLIKFIPSKHICRNYELSFQVNLFRPKNPSYLTFSSTSVWKKITYCLVAMKTQTWPK